ncbi:hypothetical protein M9X92_008444 [Pyricularia oryzae]|nr:hypothetical protein M9X92_008444 [Pyricularia oryzae]
MQLNNTFAIVVACAAYLPAVMAAFDCTIERRLGTQTKARARTSAKAMPEMIPAESGKHTVIAGTRVWVYGDCRTYPTHLPDGSTISGRPFQASDVEEDCIELDVHGKPKQ